MHTQHHGIEAYTGNSAAARFVSQIIIRLPTTGTMYVQTQTEFGQTRSSFAHDAPHRTTTDGMKLS